MSLTLSRAGFSESGIAKGRFYAPSLLRVKLTSVDFKFTQLNSLICISIKCKEKTLNGPFSYDCN